MAEDKADDKAAKAATPDGVDFTVNGVLSRLRGTLTGWVTALTGIAAAVFGGLGLGEYVQAPATVDHHITNAAQTALGMIVLGVLLILGASGIGSALRAAKQDGAFKKPRKARDIKRDALRFFPKDTAHDLLQEYKDEVRRFSAARLRNDLPGMNEATFWMNAHAERLWLWLDAYRARRASANFILVTIIMALGALLAGAGTIGFADALRRMKSSLPDNVIVQGPKSGTLTLLEAGVKEATLDGLEACTTPNTPIPVTVMKVSVPSANEDDAAWNYRAEVVPPLIGKKECVVRVYTVDNTQATVAIAVEVPAPVALETKADSSAAKK